MNSAEITRTRSVVAEQFEALAPHPIAAVAPVSSAGSSSANASGGDTGAGILRFAQFIKEALKEMPDPEKDHRRKIALEAYEKSRFYKEPLHPGQIFDRAG
jgi:hypothetical protein